MKKRPHVSMDILLEDTEEEKILSRVLKLHLIIEGLLVILIDNELNSPNSFDSYELSFPKKVDLCSAIVKNFEPELAFNLKKLNSLRNKYAHDFEYKISFEETYEYLRACIPTDGDNYSEDLVDAMTIGKEEVQRRFTILDIINQTFILTILKLDSFFEKSLIY